MCVHGYVTDWNFLTTRIGGCKYTDEMNRETSLVEMYRKWCIRLQFLSFYCIGCVLKLIPLQVRCGPESR